MAQLTTHVFADGQGTLDEEEAGTKDQASSETFEES